jgi:cytochrome c
MRWWLLAALALSAGCPTSSPPACIDVTTTCQELYPPTFDNVYKTTIKGSCGFDRVGCHSRAGHAGGMSFEDEQTAYQALTSGRVKPGDPGCSLMIVRTGSPGADYQMPPPPATPLSETEECALIKWVANGAKGPGQAIESTEAP